MGSCEHVELSSAGQLGLGAGAVWSRGRWSRAQSRLFRRPAVSAPAEDECERIVRCAKDGRQAARKAGTKFGRKPKLHVMQQTRACNLLGKGAGARGVADKMNVHYSTISGVRSAGDDAAATRFRRSRNTVREKNTSRTVRLWANKRRWLPIERLQCSLSFILLSACLDQPRRKGFCNDPLRSCLSDFGIRCWLRGLYWLETLAHVYRTNDNERLA
jgi:hypothetical protein